MQELVKNLLLAMGDTIRGLAWMGDDTKARALEKLSTFNPKIGYPDLWKDYSSVRIRRDAYWENVAAGRKFNVDDDRAQIGKPVDRGRWGMTPPTSNAYYNPLLNEIVFPAGILQPPAFSLGATDAVNYGAIGVNFTPEQQFFIAWGQFRGDAIRPETQRLMVQSDPHPTGKYRVIGSLSNMPEFHEAFGCAEDAPMVRPAGKRCEVW